MAKHQDSARFQKWSFENTALLMAEQFPQNHILIIRPARYNYKNCHKIIIAQIT